MAMPSPRRCPDDDRTTLGSPDYIPSGQPKERRGRQKVGIMRVNDLVPVLRGGREVQGISGPQVDIGRQYPEDARDPPQSILREREPLESPCIGVCRELPKHSGIVRGLDCALP